MRVKKFLNVGGGRKYVPLPAHFQGWEHVLLDIDPRGNPDIVFDARRLRELTSAEYDAVYCSHNLEHYYRHDVIKVLDGFLHVLKDSGFAHIRVPDIGAVMREVVRRNLDIEDVLYEAQAGPIVVRDVIYGFGAEIEVSGNDFYAHKTGFTQESLSLVLSNSGFPHAFVSQAPFEVVAFAFVTEPSAADARALNLSAR